mgnify:FL=1
MKSRIIQISIAVVLAVAALACILMQCYVKYDMGKDTELRYPFVAGTIDIIDGSQRLFYVKNVHMGYDRDAGEYRTDMNHYNITDDHGNVLADMREFGELKQRAGNWLAVKKGSKTAIVDIKKSVKRAEAVYTVYDDAVISSDGKYAVVKEKGICYVRNMRGKVLYESEDPNASSPKAGYIVESTTGGRQAVVNFKTGRTEYELPKGEEAVEHGSGFWVIGIEDDKYESGYSGYYLLDDRYNMAFGGRLITEYKICDGYIWLLYEPGDTYDSRNADDEYSIGEYKAAVINEEGEIVYRGEYGTFFRGISGDVLAVSIRSGWCGANDISYMYLAGDNAGEVFLTSKDLYYMDYDDGVGAVCSMKSRYAEDRRCMGGENNPAYEWSYVDEDLKRLAYGGSGGDATDGGYAVKYYGEAQFLAGFKGVIKND